MHAFLRYLPVSFLCCPLIGTQVVQRRHLEVLLLLLPSSLYLSPPATPWSPTKLAWLSTKYSTTILYY
ncbi:hypothetical protein KEM48_004452, partial [Puccinia striiformis f. sp. tritici PST-130]